jgi:hypothetical protein
VDASLEFTAMVLKIGLGTDVCKMIVGFYVVV